MRSKADETFVIVKRISNINDLTVLTDLEIVKVDS